MGGDLTILDRVGARRHGGSTGTGFQETGICNLTMPSLAKCSNGYIIRSCVLCAEKLL